MSLVLSSRRKDKGDSELRSMNVRLLFLLTLIDLSSESPLSFLRDDRTRLIYVLLEHLVVCFIVAVEKLCGLLELLCFLISYIVCKCCFHVVRIFFLAITTVMLSESFQVSS